MPSWLTSLMNLIPLGPSPHEVIAGRIDKPVYMHWDSSCEVSALNFKCTKFNVQTLKDFPSRNHLLAIFLRLGFSIGCFQEARSNSEWSRLLGNVLMKTSAAINGDYGCEVWINLSSPFCVKGGKKIYLSREGVTTVFSDPRILIVRCCSVKVDFYIISAHAPYCKSAGDGAVACEW